MKIQHFYSYWWVAQALFLLLMPVYGQAKIITRELDQDEEDGCADVIGASASESLDGTWTVAATISSDYETGWDKYADEWNVFYHDDNNTVVLGTRDLAHPHVTEQPFTRPLSGVAIPQDVTVVTLAARDSVLGYCGKEYELQIRDNDGGGDQTTTDDGSNNSSTTTPADEAQKTEAPSSSSTIAVCFFTTSFLLSLLWL